MLSEIAKDIAATVKESVQSGIKALSDKFESRIKSVEDRFDALPVPEIDYDAVKSFIAEEVAAIPIPKDGESVTIDDVRPLVKELVDAIEIPAPEKGEKGDSVTLEEVLPVIESAVEKAAQNIKVPDVDYDKIKGFVAEEVGKIPPAKDGDSIAIEDLIPVVDKAVERVAESLEAPEVDYETVKSFITDEVAKIPAPEDGKSVTIEEVRPLIDEAIRLIELPEVDYEAVKDFIAGEVAKIPAPENGKSVTVEEVTPLLKKLVDAVELPIPKDGEDGTSVTLDDLKPVIEDAVKAAVSELPAPKDGKDADPVDMEAIEKNIEDKVLASTKDAQSLMIVEVKPLIAEAVKSALAEIPKPKDGEPGKDADPINMDSVKVMIAEAVEKAVAKIRIPSPQNGENGKDALDIKILPEIEPEKSYVRGTYAKHHGGLWRSYERTHGMRGWETVVDGIADISIDYDGERSVKIVTAKSSGEFVEKEFVMPMVIDRGVYKEGQSYAKNDGVTFAGSFWIAQKDAPEGKPGDANAAFRLAVKRGRDATAQVKVR